MLRNRIFTTMFAAVVLIALLAGQAIAAPGNFVAHAQAVAPITFDNTMKISPDGHYVTYVTAQDLSMAGSTIWLGPDDGSDSTILAMGDPVSNDTWVSSPVWSPDSQQIAYVKAVKEEGTQLFVSYRFEIWAIQRDGSNNRLLTNSPLFNPALGYGGKTDMAWVSVNEIDFFDQATLPASKYALDTNTLIIQGISIAGTPPEVSAQSNIGGVPMYRQTDSPWSGDFINGQTTCGGSLPATIYHYGCTVTSAAMVLNKLGYTISGAQINPRTLNNWLSDHEGYDGCILNWWILEGINNTINVDTSNLWGADLPKLQTKIAAGFPVILWYYTSGSDMHFVVATGYSSSTISVNDPIAGPRTLDFNTIDGMVVIEGSTPPLPPGFNKISPDGTTPLDPASVNLSWEPTDHVKYYYCVEPIDGSASCPSDTRAWEMTYDTSATWPNVLTPDKEYKWQVQAWFCKDCSTNTYADDGNWWTFTTVGGDVIISGNAGIADAYLDYGNPLQTIQANSNGDYSITVPYNWSGTVTPRKTGIAFSLASKNYSNIIEDQINQNYSALIKISGSTGLTTNVGTTVSSTGGTVIVGTGGNYSVTIPYDPAGWSGTVTPSNACYTFTPTQKAYSDIYVSQLNQNYTATANIYIISGSVGLDGAGSILSYTDGTAKTATTDGSGGYSFTVSCKWTGTVTPSKSGYVFVPANKSYSNVLSNQSSQNYVAHAPVIISGNVALAGTVLTYIDGTPKSVSLDSNRNYSFSVPWNWSGTVTPSLAGYHFTPPSRTYANIQANQSVQDYAKAAQLSVGGYHACWLDLSSVLQCWGWNSYGETEPPAGTFVQVTAGDYHTCGLLSDATLQCWGANGHGQSNVPAGTYKQVDASPLNTCAVKSDGTLACWGNNDYGQASPPAGTFTQVGTGVFHACGLKSNGTIACWGWNLFQQLTTIPTGTFTQISAGDDNTCALRSNSTLACWGNNDAGQSTPPTGTFIQVSAGGMHACALRSNGSVTCWGSNEYGQATPPAGTFTEVSAGASNTCGLLTSGTIVCWGDDTHGQSQPFSRQISGNAGTPGVALRYTDVTAKTAYSDYDGSYSFGVPSGWSGTVTVSKTGYTFDQTSKSYTNVVTNISGENYVATPIVYTTTLLSTATRDGWILTGTGGSMNSTANVIQLGDDAANHQYRAILSFNTAPIPDEVTIQSAALKIKQSGAVVGTNPFSLWSLKVDEGYGFFGTSLALELADFGAVATHNAVATFDPTPVGGWYSANLNAIGMIDLNLFGQTQFRLRFNSPTNNDGGADYIKFLSGDYTSGQPQLVITYIYP